MAVQEGVLESKEQAKLPIGFPLLKGYRMTVWKQRFYRWNFFFVNGIYYDLWYILFSWKLGWWELGAKVFVFQEVYETLLYLLAPFVLPISFVVRPYFTAYMIVATLGLYMVNVLIFNYVSFPSSLFWLGLLCLFTLWIR